MYGISRVKVAAVHVRCTANNEEPAATSSKRQERWQCKDEESEGGHSFRTLQCLASLGAAKVESPKMVSAMTIRQ
jgi:hypothetical protein